MLNYNSNNIYKFDTIYSSDCIESNPINNNNINNIICCGTYYLNKINDKRFGSIHLHQVNYYYYLLLLYTLNYYNYYYYYY